MALFREGSFDDFAYDVASPPAGRAVAARRYSVLNSRGEVSTSSRLQPKPSSEQRGLALKALTLKAEFQSHLARLLRKTSNVYFIAWSWDLSGEAPFTYPSAGARPDTCLIPLKGGQLREFLGSGTLLLPARVVYGGISARLQIWESRKGTRHFGETLSNVAETINKSRLTEVLTGISLLTGLQAAEVALIEAAAVEVADLVGKVLQQRSDSYVDFYEGYFESTKPWAPPEASYTGVASEIVLTRLG